MAKDLKIDPLTNDLDFSSLFDLVTIEGADEVAQHITTEIGTDRGGPGIGHAIDNAFGLPYFEVIFVDNPDLGLITSVVRGVITKRVDIVEVIFFEALFEDATGELDINFEAETTEGLVSVSLEV